MVVCDMVTAPAAARAARPAGRHAVTARRLVDAFISRLRGRPSAPAADPPAGRKLLTTRKTRGTTMRRRRSASPYFRLINYWRRQNAAAAAAAAGRPTGQVLPANRRWKLIDYVSVHALSRQPSCFVATSVMRVAYGNRCRFCSRCTTRHSKNYLTAPVVFRTEP